MRFIHMEIGLLLRNLEVIFRSCALHDWLKHYRLRFIDKFTANGNIHQHLSNKRQGWVFGTSLNQFPHYYYYQPERFLYI